MARAVSPPGLPGLGPCWVQLSGHQMHTCCRTCPQVWHIADRTLGSAVRAQQGPLPPREPTSSMVGTSPFQRGEARGCPSSGVALFTSQISSKVPLPPP